MNLLWKTLVCTNHNACGRKLVEHVLSVSSNHGKFKISSICCSSMEMMRQLPVNHIQDEGILCCIEDMQSKYSIQKIHILKIVTNMFMFTSWLFRFCRENSLLRAQKDEADSVQSLAKSGHVTQSSQPITTHDMFVALQVNKCMVWQRWTWKFVINLYNMTRLRFNTFFGNHIVYYFPMIMLSSFSW